MTDATLAPDAKSDEISFLDNKEHAVLQELWTKFPKYDTLASRALAKDFEAWLSSMKPEEHRRLVKWTEAYPATAGGKTTEPRRQDLVFAALCKAALQKRVSPSLLVEEIKQAGTAVGILIQSPMRC